MNILSISHIYNEGLYLEDNYNYLKSQGISQFLYIDNMSVDKYDVKAIFSKYDTRSSFHLLDLQKEMIRITHILKPDWVVYTAPDLYYTFEGTIREEIEKAEYHGYNQINAMCWGALNTGEEMKLPLRKHFFYGVPWTEITLISKYDSSLFANGDNLFIDDPNVYESDGIIINYGGCKTAIDQDIKLNRINKAREQGQRATIGTHYAKYQAKGYKWGKEELKDLREVELLKKLIDS